MDAPEVRSIVLLRPCTNMIEFKQIVGRGTRLYDGKDFFTIYDFVDAYQNFLDPEWDGPPENPEPPRAAPAGAQQGQQGEDHPAPPGQQRPDKIKIQLADGKVRQIGTMTSTSFWDADGTPISAEQFMVQLFGTLPDFFTSEQELRELWAAPATRKALLEQLAANGFDTGMLNTLRELIDAEKSDLFDLLEYVSFAVPPITREARVQNAGDAVFRNLSESQAEFVQFVLERYVATGVEALSQSQLPSLLKLKYGELPDAVKVLGENDVIKTTFIDFQRFLYNPEGSKSTAS